MSYHWEFSNRSLAWFHFSPYCKLHWPLTERWNFNLYCPYSFINWPYKVHMPVVSYHLSAWLIRNIVLTGLMAWWKSENHCSMCLQLKLMKRIKRSSGRLKFRMFGCVCLYICTCILKILGQNLLAAAIVGLVGLLSVLSQPVT